MIAALVFLGLAPASYAQDAAVVRLSYVNGTVQISQGGTVQFDKAVANMPLFQGSQVSTGNDGEAEMEFADGSVARLTPNTALLLTHLQRPGASGHTDLELLNGLGYFELNVGQGQRFSVKVASATAHPEENSIFRANLDTAPEIALFQGVLRVDGQGGAFAAEVNERESVHLDAGDTAQYSLVQTVAPDSWDQWNIDRDEAIARDAQSQTDARNDSAAPQDPGWNDLDAYGDWYPVEGYGNVWVPDGVDADWDPFGYGYWASYPTYGVTWISGYPWGWLPFHCGAWNYFPFGWGWVPGGCGLGWSPIVTIWNAPLNYRLPYLPQGGFPIAGRGRIPGKPTLVPVDRGAAARGPWSLGATWQHTRAVAEHTQPLRYNGQDVQPIVHMPAPGAGLQGGRLMPGAHVGIPVARPSNGVVGNPLAGRLPVRPGVSPGGEGTRAPVVTRPVYTPPPAPRSEPAPRAEPAPHVSAPPPAPAAPSRPH